MKGIVKEFPGVRALKGVDFSVAEGEVHALMGENGAGKSTLMKILSGVYTPTEGIIRIGEKEYKSLTPQLSQENKIAIIYQELSVINEKAAEYAQLQTSPLSAAKRGYVDNIISAAATRKYVIGAFEMLYTKREERPSKKHGTV